MGAKRTMANLVILTGIPGTGKTTVIAGVLDHLKTYKEVNYGTLMFEMAKEQKLVKERDELRKLPKDVQMKLSDATARKIAEMAQIQNILLDTHCTVKTAKGYMPGLRQETLMLMKPAQFILLESDDKEIYARRQKDDTRKRDDDTVEQIHEQQMLNRAYAAALSAATGAFVSVVKNHDGKLKEAVKHLVELLK